MVFRVDGRIPNQVSIDERPANVDAKQRFGDGERDTVIGKGHRGALVTLVERKSRYTVIRAVHHKRADVVRQAVKQGLTPYRERVHTITYDNGREFTDYPVWPVTFNRVSTSPIRMRPGNVD